MSLLDWKNAGIINQVVEREQIVFKRVYMWKYLKSCEDSGLGRESEGRDYDDKKMELG